MIRTYLIGFLLGGWLMLLCVGCGKSGPAVASVRGRITLDGQALQNATITFQPTSGRPSFGLTDEDGQYTMNYTQGRAGVMLGTNTIFIRTYREDEEGRVVQREFLPAKYHDRSDIKVEVEAKKNVFDFDLTSQPK